MEPRTLVEIECPQCGSSAKARARQYINVQANPRGREDLLAGKLNLYRCRGCGYSNALPVDVFYHDAEKEFCVQYVPQWLAEDNDFLDSLDDRSRPALFESAPDTPAYFHDVHLVLSMNELVAYVALRERLWERRASAPAPGLVTCFSCDRSIEHGEHYYCVSRIVKKRGARNPDGDRAVDSFASLQVCADCRRCAETQPIAFGHAPVPLLRLEQEGFHRFARERGNWASQRSSDAPWDSTCSLCRTAIGRGKQYVAIELSEETSCHEGVETLQVHAQLARVCGPCSELYMVWL